MTKKATKKIVKSKKVSKLKAEVIKPLLTPKTIDERVREILDMIDNVLAAPAAYHKNGVYPPPTQAEYENREVAGKLWDVLSALRGPDNDTSMSVKDITTGIIRRHAFPKTFIRLLGQSKSQISITKAISYSDTLNNASLRSQFSYVSAKAGEHFNDHSTLAFAALGLKKAEVNPDK